MIPKNYPIKSKQKICNPTIRYSDTDGDLTLITTDNGDIELRNNKWQLLWKLIPQPKANYAYFLGSFICIIYTNNIKDVRDYAGNLYTRIK